jgi:hypothetical protein
MDGTVRPVFTNDELAPLLARLDCTPGRLSALVGAAARWPELWFAGRPIPPMFQQRLRGLAEAPADI